MAYFGVVLLVFSQASLFSLTVNKKVDGEWVLQNVAESRGSREDPAHVWRYFFPKQTDMFF
jgi:hypothetical protein